MMFCFHWYELAYLCVTLFNGYWNKTPACYCDAYLFIQTWQFFCFVFDFKLNRRFHMGTCTVYSWVKLPLKDILHETKWLNYWCLHTISLHCSFFQEEINLKVSDFFLFLKGLDSMWCFFFSSFLWSTFFSFSFHIAGWHSLFRASCW